MVVWILAALAAAAIWFAGYLLAWPLGLEIGLTAGVLALVALTFVLRRWRANAAARALERELMKQAEAQVANARPDRRAEIYELQAQFKKGLGALKASKLGARGPGALYALPWYVIVGPPGAGKTTALRHSGLEFPFTDATGAASLKGVGGTRNCDWWFTNEAILLDTAGRFATQEDDRDEWVAFLDLLRRYRARKPVNGVIVAVSVSEIAQATEEQVEAMAKTLRARVDELTTRLKMVVPVYVVFTKTDLVAGFIETFDELKKSERAQVWGATFPLDGNQADDPRKAFEAEFDALVEALHAQALRRIATVAEVERRVRVLQFPLEVRSLKDGLAEFVATLLSKNAFQETPLFRGVYFTSGTQEGHPLDRVMAKMARAFTLRPLAVPEASGLDAKSYFLTDLFRKVVFPDQDVAARTSTEVRRQVLGRIAFAVGSLALAALIAIAPATSFGKNREMVREAAAVADSASRIDWARDPLTDSVDRLQPLGADVEQLGAWRTQGAPIGWRWGMYVGNALYGPLRDELVALIQRGLAAGPKRAIEERLRTVDALPDRASDDFNRRYDDLKMDLMLTEREHLDPAWIAPRVARQWADLGGGLSPKSTSLLEHELSTYFSLVSSGEVAPMARDERVVSYIRSELARAPHVGLYDNLVRDTNTEIAPIRIDTIFYGSIAPFVTSKTGVIVQGAYTKAGWTRIRRLLDVERSKLTSEGWVIGRDEQVADGDIEKQVHALRQAYFENYRDAWRDFVADLVVARPDDAASALQELLALSEPEWPYLRLIRMLDENATIDLTDAESGDRESLLQQATDLAKQKLLGQAVDAGGILNRPRRVSTIERAFRPLTSFGMPPAETKPDAPPPPTGLTQYQAMLKKLIGVLSDVKAAKAPADPKAITGEFETAFRATSGLLGDQDAFTRPLLSPLLLDPITAAWASVLKDAGGAAGGIWEVTAYKAWSTKVGPLYPFDEAARDDVRLDDFASFFRPQAGQLWAFYDQTLKSSLELQGDVFVPARRFQSAVAYSDPFLACLRDAKRVTDAFFDLGAKDPSLAFDLKLHSVSPDVSEVTLEIDGVARTYKNSPEEWTRLEWPAKDAKARGGRVKVTGLGGLDEEIVRSGDFGFFRLLGAAEVKPGQAAGAAPGDPPVLVATWSLRTQKGAVVKMDLRPARASAPFQRGFFGALRCPRLITSEAR